MDAPANIGRREREILTAVVESYISTGEPVGSRTLARANRENLSAASIRNVMADLADAGFLEQPHTSAGRVPTTKAYRYYVKQLTGEARLSPADARRPREDAEAAPSATSPELAPARPEAARSPEAAPQVAQASIVPGLDDQPHEATIESPAVPAEAAQAEATAAETPQAESAATAEAETPQAEAPQAEAPQA